MQSDDAAQKEGQGMHRVKLYKLNNQGLWDDKGTGHVGLEFLPKPNAPGLVVVGETDCRVLLVHKICNSGIYTRQGDNTIITWMDADIGTDVALSFEEEVGCHAVWEQIQNSSAPSGRASPLPAGTNGTTADDNGQEDSPPLSPGDSPSASGDPSPMAAARAAQMSVKLPSPELSTLSEISKALSEVPMGQREWVAMYIQQEGTYLSRLLALFRDCEGQGDGLRDREALTQLFLIVKSLIMMNDMGLIDEMMREEHFWGVLGCLEYDPDLAPGKNVAKFQVVATIPEESLKAQIHTTFRLGYIKDAALLRMLDDITIAAFTLILIPVAPNVAKFQEVVTIPEESLKAKIHTTFRLGYIKDAVLPRALDDMTMAALHSMMMFNYMDILQSLHALPDYFAQIFRKMRACGRDSEEMELIVTYLQEICNLTGYPQFQCRNDVVSNFFKEDVLGALSRCLSSRREAVTIRAMEILLMLVHNDTCTVRTLLTASPPTLLTQLVSLLLGESLTGLPEQALDCLRSLLDYETVSANGEQGGPGSSSGTGDTDNPFLNLFYDIFIERAMVVIIAAGNAAEEATRTEEAENAGEGAGGGDSEKGPVPYIVGLVVELLHFCVMHHMFHVKYYVLRHNILQKVLRLLKSRKKWLAAAALRLLRACIGLKDDFYMGYVVRNSLLRAPIEAFLANGDQPDLLNSTFLEIVEFIRAQNIKPLIEYLIDSHWDDLQGIKYVSTFQQLKDKYDAMKDPALPQPGQRSPPPCRLRPRRPGELQQEEEAYFEMNSDDDDDDGSAAGSSSGGASPILRATSPPLRSSLPPAAAAAGSGGSGGAAATDATEAAPHGSAWLPAAGRTSSGDPPGPNIATAFNGARQAGVHVAWPPSAPMSAFAGLVEYEEDDEEGDEGDSPSGSVGSSPPTSNSNAHRLALQPASLPMFQRVRPSIERGGRSRGPMRFSPSISARKPGNAAALTEEDGASPCDGERWEGSSGAGAGGEDASPPEAAPPAEAGAGLHVEIGGGVDATEGSDGVAAAAGLLTPSKRRTGGEGDRPEAGGKGRKVAKVDSEESTHTSSLV